MKTILLSVLLISGCASKTTEVKPPASIEEALYYIAIAICIHAFATLVH